ncbi:MAG: AMP-binding protein, partial [candidate division Zixibacteria bacterium]|nr:AMP-binding protein [candidate division Zixibacteria bacterium]
EYQFEDLVDKLSIPRDTSRNPIFNVIFNMLNQQEYTGKIPQIAKQDFYDHTKGVAKFDLTLTAIEMEDKLFCAFEYSTKLFKPVTIERFITYFKNILLQLSEKIEQKLSEIEIITDSEKQQILFEFNNTAIEYPDEKTINDLFETQARKRADNIAVVFGDVYITYDEVNKKANQVARLLRKQGVEPDNIVAIILDRSIEIIIGILAVLKAGAAYLPIDPDFPVDRIKFMLKDSGVKNIITDRNIDVHSKVDKIINLNDPHIYKLEATNLEKISNEDNLLYLIYTSGSTGRPKGVLVNHRSFVNLVYNQQKVFKENSESRMSQVASVSFDAMAAEVWPCLLCGAQLYIVNNQIRMDVAKLKQWLIDKEITISFQSTVIVEQLLSEKWPEEIALKILYTAGDKLTKYPEQRYPFKLFNLYGPTEDTVWTTWKEIKINKNPERLPGIGKPIGNHQVYITGPNSELQPLGVPGELCISGKGLAVGYLNHPGL